MSEKKPNEIWQDTQDKVIADIFAAFDGYTLYECQRFCELATKKIELAIRLNASKTPFFNPDVQEAKRLELQNFSRLIP